MAITRVKNPDGSFINIEHPDGAIENDILGFAASQFNRGQGEEGLFGDITKSVEVGLRRGDLNSRAGQLSNLAQFGKFILPYISQVSFAGGPTVGTKRKINEAGLRAKAADLRTEADAMSNTVGLDPDFEQSLGGQAIQGMGQYGSLLPYLALGPGGIASNIAGQMDSEAVKEAENTTGKKLADFSDEELNQTNMVRYSQQLIGTALNMFAISKLIPSSIKGKVNNFLLKNLPNLGTYCP